jgi:peptidoglycan-associated lipoprotein
MQKKKWIFLALLLVIPGLMFSVSCQKKLVDASPQPMAKEEPKPEPKAEPAPAPAPVAYKAPGVIMQEDIYFDFDKATLTPSAQDNLLRKAEWLRENSDVTVTVEGHCDARGTNEYNLALGDRRAESAKAFLVDLGIAASRITTISYGEERPVCTQQDEECWAKNRRDNFVVN